MNFVFEKIIPSLLNVQVKKLLSNMLSFQPLILYFVVTFRSITLFQLFSHLLKVLEI